MKKGKIYQWLPGIAGECLAVVFCIIYVFTDGSDVTTYIQLIGTQMLAFVVPLYNLIFSKSLPTGISWACVAFVFMASALGTSMDFYHKIWFWDLLMHAASGLLFSFVIFAFILDWGGRKLNPVGCMVLIFGFALGVSAFWEIGEYFCDTFIGSDAQRVKESLENGVNPIADTVEDMSVTIVGVAVFYIILFIDKLAGYMFFSKAFGFKGFEKTEVGESKPAAAEHATQSSE